MYFDSNLPIQIHRLQFPPVAEREPEREPYCDSTLSFHRTLSERSGPPHAYPV